MGISFQYCVCQENISIATLEWEQPIPTALSHLLVGERFGIPPLVQYDIINNSKEEVNLTVETEIETHSNKQEETRAVLPYSAIRINHTPLFKSSIAGINEMCLANLKMKVSSAETALLHKTTRLRLLAFDTMIFEILNPLTQRVFNLHDFLSVWVTPHNKDVQKIISIAKEYHPEKTLQGYPASSNMNEIRKATYLQCEALFMALKEIGISYVDSSISFGWSLLYQHQRIQLPGTSIITKKANCIDGAVLFASLLEHIGLGAILVLVPGHALVGWFTDSETKNIALLETTLISSEDFRTALHYGQVSLRNGLESARKSLRNPQLTIEQATSQGIIRFIDVRKMREKEILPQPYA